MKKLLSIALVSTLLVSGFSACSPSTPDAPVQSPSPVADAPSDAPASDAAADGKSGKLVVWAWDPAFNIAIMNEAADRYKKINPNVEIEVMEMAKSDVEQKLHTTLSSKMTEGLPDIVLIEDYNAQKYLQSYPGSFANLTDSIDYSKFAPYKVELMTLGGNIYGIPFDSGATGFFYRTDLLEESGFKAEDLNDITWDRFIEIGTEVKNKTGKPLLSFDKSDGGIMRTMLNSSGKWYFDAEGNPTISNNEALKEAFTLYTKIIDSGIIKPVSGWNEWVGAFNTDAVASVSSGVWIVGSIKSAADQSGKWAVAPIPRLNYAESVNASNLGGSSWYILDGAKEKDLAIDFMNTIYANDVDFYQNILENNGAVACFLPAQSGSAYTAPQEYFGGQAIFSDISTWMSKIPSINYGLYTYEADAAVMGQLDDVLAGKKTVDEALKNAETQLLNQIQ